MIVNRTSLTKNDLEFALRKSQKEPRVIFTICFIAFCGVLLLILGGIRLRGALSSGGGAGLAVGSGAITMGVLFILRSIFHNKLAVRRALRLPSLNTPRTYEFSEDGVTVRLSLNGVEADERYAFSIMDGYFERNGAIYIRLTVDKLQRFLAVHNDTYYEGSREDLATLLESRGVTKKD